MTSPSHLAEQLKKHLEVKWQNPGAPIAPESEFLFLMTRFGIEQPVRFVVDRLVLGNSFTYRQVSGLFEYFVHTIKFEEHGQGDTLVTDIVEYENPFGLLGRIADDVFVRKDLKRILEDRLEAIYEKFKKENVTAEKTAAI
jgi:ligand-binding SRPBCC domain-containing protein